MNDALPRRVEAYVWAGLFAFVLFVLTGCGDPNSVRVQLRSGLAPDNPATVREIQAQVAGPLDDLRYKWFAVAGQCEPQESQKPQTLFRFAEGVRVDEVTVEVWRKDKRVAESQLKVKFDDGAGESEGRTGAGIQILITNIPPAELGGPNSRSDIAGLVQGATNTHYGIVLYTRAFGAWYIQPVSQMVHPLQDNFTWESWTHTGSKYAAVLVQAGYEPMDKLDMLPEVKGAVLSCAIVDGIVGDQKAPTNTVK